MISIIITMMACLIIMPSVLASSTMRIFPVDDAFVRSNYPDTNYQTESWKQNLRAGYEESFGTDKSYLKFDLSELAGKTVNSMTFSIFAISNHDNPVLNLFYVSSNSWSEDTITWNNAPSTSTFISSQSIVSGGAPERVEYDLTQYAESSTLSLSLQENGDMGFANFYSKDKDSGNPGGQDDEQDWPYLEINYEDQEPECTTQADTNEDGMIDMVELVDHITKWKQGEIGMIELVNTINLWKAGEGC